MVTITKEGCFLIRYFALMDNVQFIPIHLGLEMRIHNFLSRKHFNLSYINKLRKKHLADDIRIIFRVFFSKILERTPSTHTVSNFHQFQDLWT